MLLWLLAWRASAQQCAGGQCQQAELGVTDAGGLPLKLFSATASVPFGHPLLLQLMLLPPLLPVLLLPMLLPVAALPPAAAAAPGNPCCTAAMQPVAVTTAAANSAHMS